MSMSIPSPVLDNYPGINAGESGHVIWGEANVKIPYPVKLIGSCRRGLQRYDDIC